VLAATTDDPQFAASLELTGLKASLRLTAVPAATLVLEDLGRPQPPAPRNRSGTGLELALPASLTTGDAPPPALGNRSGSLGGNLRAELVPGAGAGRPTAG